MIKSWNVENYKSVCKKTTLEFKPLTIFAGANSSGKSTFLQSILLVAQTLSNDVVRKPVILNGHYTKLGQFDDLISERSKKNIISIGFEVYVPSEESIRYVTSSRYSKFRDRYYSTTLKNKDLIGCNFSFNAPKEKKSIEINQLHPALNSCDISLKDKNEKLLTKLSAVKSDISPNNKAKKLGINIKDPKNKRALDCLMFDVKIKSNSIKMTKVEDENEIVIFKNHFNEETLSENPIGCTFTHFLPESLGYIHNPYTSRFFSELQYLTMPISFPTILKNENFKNESKTISKKIIKKIMEIFLDNIAAIEDVDKKNQVVKAINTLKKDITAFNLAKLFLKMGEETQDILNKSKSELVSLISPKKKEIKGIQYTFPHQILADSRGIIELLFSSMVRYLGPLRDTPKPVYPAFEGSTDPEDIGIKGEYTAAVLDLFQNKEITYIPSKYFKNLGNTQKQTKTTLLKAVIDWLEYMGIVKNVKTIDKGIYGHELKVSSIDSKSLHSLMHVGVGVSQVLPVLVMSLLAPKNSILIFEQPEIHLHPKVQSLLADFLLSMSISEKQCIVETHSEYFIDRLRLRSAAEKEDNVSEIIQLYFVEKKQEESKYRNVKINKFGAIMDWPDGFFDQSSKEAADILKYAMIKHKNG